MKSQGRAIKGLCAVIGVGIIALGAAPVYGQDARTQAPDDHPAIRFLSRAEAASALTTGAEKSYYAGLQLAEMRAKTGLPLVGITLEAAREQVRASYAASTEDFSAEEQQALGNTVRGALAAVRTSAPLYSRTPWSFIKVEGRIEGGLPHTRGDSIVLADAFLASMSRRYGADWASAPADLRALLIHEQTHILQRRHPELFVPLYTDAFGFRRVNVRMPPWLLELAVTNPDGPAVDWAFPIGAGSARRWLLPEIVLTRADRPRMPDDFATVAVEIHEQPGGAWSLPGSAKELSPLSVSQDYQRAFPDHSEDFHPNEISAGMLSALLLGLPLRNPSHELWDKTRTWVAKSLR